MAEPKALTEEVLKLAQGWLAECQRPECGICKMAKSLIERLEPVKLSELNRLCVCGDYILSSWNFCPNCGKAIQSAYLAHCGLVSTRTPAMGQPRLSRQFITIALTHMESASDG